MNKTKRLFFAVNLPAEYKREIAETFFPMIAKDKWRIVLPENLHVTLLFLGHIAGERIAKLQEQAMQLREFEAFEAEVNCVGHFDGRVLWLGIGKGNEELNLLSRKLQQAINVSDERFHAHVTIARNRGAKRQKAQQLVEEMRQKIRPKKIMVKNFELMESLLHKAGPEYKVVFSIPLAEVTAGLG